MREASRTVGDMFDDEQFEQLLCQAEREAKSTFARDFVDDMNERYEKYGMRMFISLKQVELLQRIASGD